MRIVFVGAGSTATTTAEMLLREGHEVIFIERDAARIDVVGRGLDCGLIHGDGSVPAILQEADPADTDVLFCMTDNDQVNIIASLVGRSLGFRRVVTKIVNPQFEHVCIELRLDDTIVPHRAISRFLVDMVRGRDTLELSTVFREEVRFFTFVARPEDAGPAKELNLPRRSRVIGVYRGGEWMIAEGDTRLHVGDEVVVVTHCDEIEALRQRWRDPLPRVRHKI